MEPNKKDEITPSEAEEVPSSTPPTQDTLTNNSLAPVPDIETEPATGTGTNNIDPDPQTALENMDPDASPAQKAAVFAQPKKSHKKLFALIALVLVLFIGAAVAYYFLYMQPKPVTTPTSDVTPANSTTTAEVQAATDSLTTGATAESDLTNTDDSSFSTDADTSAGNVGDSVDESKF